MLFRLIFVSLLLHNTECSTNEQCEEIVQHDFSKECTNLYDLKETINKHKNEPCKKNKYCPLMHALEIKQPPISSLMKLQMSEMIYKCCGNCLKSNDERMFNEALRNLSHYNLIFPVLGSKDANNLYGFYFIPVVEIPIGTYVTKERKKQDIVFHVLHGVTGLWPLLVILLLFAFLAGIIAWAIETWNNEEDFARSFTTGLFDGFWWAYVSMTTVGYGDKATKSKLGRLFSVIWILIGITIFSLLTASLTNIITEANKEETPMMLGQSVGVLKGRTYDAELVTKNGGILDEVASTNFTQVSS